MPLNAEDEMAVGRLQTLNQPVGREGSGSEPSGEGLDTLVVHAVYSDDGCIEQGAELRSFGHFNVMHQEIPGVLIAGREIVVFDGAWELSGEVLMYGAPGRHVQHLNPTAHGQQGLVIFQG